MLLSILRGLRVFQSVPRRGHDLDVLAGSHAFDPVRVLGITESNEFGTVVFQAPADQVTAWDLIGHDGAAIVHERVWSLVQPGEVRACGGCHVPPQFPFTQREIGPFPPPTDLRTQGKVYTFVDDVLPILRNECHTCHTMPSPGGLDLRGDRTTFDALEETIDGRTPREYVDQGDARHSFLFQLLAGDAKGHNDHQTRIDAINASTDHTSLLTPDQLYAIATWIDTGAGFAFLPYGESEGGPSAVGVLPRPDSGDAPQNTGVALHFNAPMDRATLDEGTFTLHKVGGSEVAGTWQWGNNRDVLLKPDAPLAAGDYQVNITGAALDVKNEEVGNALAGSFSAQFTAGSASDTAAPSPTARVPDGTPASIDGPIVLRFSEPMEPGSVSDSTLWVETANGGHRVEGRVGVSADGREASFAPNLPFKAGATYTLHLKGDVRDLAGNALPSEASFQFITATQSEPLPLGLWATPGAGDNPRGVAVTPDGSDALVTDYWGNRLLIIDMTTWTETTLDLDHRVGGIAVNPDGTRAYVMRPELNDVVVVNLTNATAVDLEPTSAEIDGIPVGSTPISAVHHPTASRLFVVGRDSSEVSVIDTQTNQELARWPVNGEGPEDRDAHGITLSPDGSQLLVTSRQRLSILDVDDGHLVRRFDELPGWNYFGVAVTPDGNQVWLASADSNELIVIDLRIAEIVAHVPVGDYPTWLALSPDGAWIYVSNLEGGNISVMRRDTATVLNTLNAHGNIYALALSADGQRLFATDDVHNALLVFQQADTADKTGPTVDVITPADNADGLSAISPLVIMLNEAVDRASVNGSTFGVSQDSSSSLSEPDSASPQAEVAINGEYVFSNDNRTVTFLPDSPWQAGTTYRLRLESGLTDMAGNPLGTPETSLFTIADTLDPPPVSLRSETYASSSPVAMALSPNGSLLAIANHYWDFVSLLAPDTLIEQAEIEVGDGACGLAFSSDGSQLYVVNRNNASLSIIDVASRQVAQVVDNVGTTPAHVVLSPDGASAYVSGYYNGGLDRVDLITREVTRLRELKIPGRPAFDAAGRLYVPERDRLWRRNTDGSWESLYVGGGYIDQVAFSTDGRHAYLSMSWQDRLNIVDLTLWREVYTLPTGQDPRALAQTADRRLLIVANAEAGAAQILDGATWAVLQTASLPGGYLKSFVWDEARRRLYVGDTNAGKVQSFSVVHGNTAGADYADVNGDGDVNMDDVQILTDSWHEDPSYDRTGDGVVDAADVMFVIANMPTP